MPRPPGPLPPGLVAAPFHVRTARDAGVGAERLRGRDLVAPFHAVRAQAGSLHTVADRCHAAAARMRPDQFFSHATVVDLLGLPLPARLRTAAVHVASPRPGRAPRAAGMLGHSVDTTLVEVVRHGELRVVHPVGAWCQLATDLTVRELVVLGDALVRRHDPWATREELEAAVVAFRGRGKRRLVAALELVRPRTDSPPETELRLDILEAGLPEPGVNVAIHDVHGRLIAIGDLVFVEYKVVVEYDGEQHRTDDAQYARDVERLDDLAQEGYRVIRVNKHHRGGRRRAVLTKIRKALLERGWTPGG